MSTISNDGVLFATACLCPTRRPRVFDIDCSTYYESKRRVERHGLEALRLPSGTALRLPSPLVERQSSPGPSALRLSPRAASARGHFCAGSGNARIGV